MKKILSILILSVIAFSNIAFAEPIIVEPAIIPVDTGQMELQPIPFDPGQMEIQPMLFDPYIDDPSIEIFLDLDELDGGRAALHWTRYDGPNFQYYKVMHSQEVQDPVYPIDPELEFFENQNKTGFIHQNTPVGDNFYRICVITSDDKRGCSNSRFMFKAANYGAGGVEIDEPEERPGLDRDRDPLPRDEGMVDLQNTNKKSFQLFKFLWANLGIILALFAIIIAASGFTFASKRKQKSISKYMNKIDDTFTEYKMKAKRCEAELYRLKDIIDDELKLGKIDDGAFHLLMGRIENYMVEIQKQIVNERFGGLPVSLKEEMFQMMEDGEITESEFETMQKLIKRSELSASDQDSLLDQMKEFKKQDELMKKKGK